MTKEAEVQTGGRYRFAYPAAFTTLPRRLTPKGDRWRE